MTNDRYTRKDVETALKQFCGTAGFRVAKDYTDVGGYALDKGHGGYTVIQLMERGGQSQPFGFARRNAREMAQTLRFATDAIYRMKQSQEQ